MTILIVILLYVASIFTIGRWLAKASRRVMTQVRLFGIHTPPNLNAWLLFPVSAAESSKSQPISQFDFGMYLVGYRTRLYTAGLASLWPIKVIANAVLLVVTLLLFTPALDRAR